MKTLSILLMLGLLSFGCFGQKYTLPYFQDFEGTTFLPQGWEAFGSNGNAAWEHSTSVGAFGKSSSCAFFDNFTNNVAGNYYGMRSVRLDLTNAIKPTLSFDVAYARRNTTNSDRLGIWYSFNGTSNWMNLMNFENGTLTTAPDQNTYFTPSATQWDSISIDLSQFAGQSLIRIAFENNSNFGNVMYIDNVHFYDKAKSSGINVANADFKTEVFPNPATDKLIFTFPDKEKHQVELFSVLGSKLLSTEMEDDDILPLDHLKAGIYYAIIDRNEAVKIVKK